MEKISIVVPCYNEENAILKFYEEINKVIKKMKKIEFELLFIDDGSRDNTLKVIKDLAKRDKRIKYLSFSRNFGKEAGIYAGLENSTGDYVTFMDVDLQDPPELLPKMYNCIKEKGFDIVGTKRATRKGEPALRNLLTKCYYKLIAKISKIEMVEGARDYRLMTRQVADAILSMKEYNRYSKGLFSFVGFKTKWIEFENRKRSVGNSKWSFFDLFLYAFDGIIDFSTVPLSIATFLGILFCILSFIAIIVIIVKTLCFGDPVGGWPSMVCIIFMVSGIQLFCLGIIGAYLSRTYQETKKRPKYIVREKN